VKSKETIVVQTFFIFLLLDLPSERLDLKAIAFKKKVSV